VVVCTGSAPSRTGYQRSYPHRAELPGAGQDNVFTAHDVLEGRATAGERVLLLDDINGWWPASGTALHLAKLRHQVTIVTAAEKAAAALDLSATGDTTRERFAKMGIEVLLATALDSWQGSTAKLVNLYTGDSDERTFDTLVLATTNTPEDKLSRELAGAGIEVKTIGDAVAARSASMAFYEARKLALAL
jgi:NADH dehydrogenase FAD-containing subunit